MSRRILAFVLTLVMAVSLLPFSVFAAGVTDSGSCGENLTYTLTDDGVLTVSGTGAMTDSPWSAYASQITDVVIEDGVTAIVDFAFLEHKNLTDVTIPESVTSVGEYAFCDCSSLTAVTVPAGVTTIGRSAFGGCFVRVDEANPNYSSDEYGVLFDKNKTLLISAPTNLQGQYDIPAGVTTIGEEVFFGCKGLTGITVPEGVTAIAECAFAVCTNLAGITLPESLTSIGDFALDECTGLTEIVIPKAVTAIGGCAFYGCTGLTTVRFQGNAPSFGDYYEYGIFEGVTATVYYPAGNPTWTAEVRQNYGGTLTWKTDAVEKEPAKPVENPFADVTEGMYYYAPVLWAFDEGVTTGVTPTTFEPDATCTRAQVVTFLWRAAGSPEPKATDCPFTDVELGSWYSKAVLWAAENGITTGTSATTFAPSATILREQFVTFLWRAVTGGKPILTVDCPFGDIPEDAYYYDAVLWATQNGYCTGMGSDQFGPQGSCTRGQTVTFLYRYYAGTPVTAPSAIALSTRTLHWTDMAHDDCITYKLNAEVLPAGADNTAVTWTSSNPSVATVSQDGVVSVTGRGNVTITAQCGNAVAYCQILPLDTSISWFVDRSHHYLTNNLVVNSYTNPWAGTYMTSEGHECVITIIFAEVMTNGGWWDSRFITTVYDLTADKTIHQPAEYYEKQADKAWGQEKFRYMEMVNEFLNIELNYKQLTEYYQKGLELGLESYWVPVGQ